MVDPPLVFVSRRRFWILLNQRTCSVPCGGSQREGKRSGEALEGCVVLVGERRLVCRIHQLLPLLATESSSNEGKLPPRGPRSQVTLEDRFPLGGRSPCLGLPAK